MTPGTRIPLLALTLMTLALLAGAPAASAQDDWTFAVTPYVWLPTLNGTLSYDLPEADGGRFDVEVGPNDYLTNLNVALMVSGEARKGRFVVASDLVLLDLSSQRSNIRSVVPGEGQLPINVSVNRDTETELSGLAWTVAGGFGVGSNPDSPIDLIAGVRYFGLETETDWDLSATVDTPGGSVVLARTGTISEDVDLWDGIIGLRGRAKLGERWAMPYYVDAGTGTSALTWQAMVGATRSFNWGDVGLSYRHLSYDQDPDELLADFSFSGPAVSFRFTF